MKKRHILIATLALSFGETVYMIYIWIMSALFGNWKVTLNTNIFGEGIPEIIFFSAIALLCFISALVVVPNIIGNEK